jgi:myosin heavy subunit
MADYNYGTPTNTPKKSNSLPIVIGLLLASIGANAFLFFNKQKQQEIIVNTTSKLTESERLKGELEKQYYQALQDLEKQRGDNKSLNDQIETMKVELKTSKDRIAKMLGDSKNLVGAKKEMASLRTQVDGYLAEISKLKEENQKLVNTNTTLTQEKKELVTNLDEQKKTNEELVTAKTVLISEKEKLATENTVLSKKVNIASVVKVANIQVNGFKVRSNGKEVDKNRAKVIDGLKICFDATDNNVVEQGVEQFYIRIINPNGETQALENMGSGVLVNQANNEQIKYTSLKGVKYENKAQNTCMNWQPNIPFQQGTYTVEVYNKGYLAGSSTFALK